MQYRRKSFLNLIRKHYLKHPYQLMLSRVNVAQLFHKFAKDKLKMHVTELKAKYKTRNLLLKNEKTKKAFYTHLGRYRSELNKRRNQLIKSNPELKKKLDKICKVYLRKFQIEYG